MRGPIKPSFSAMRWASLICSADHSLVPAKDIKLIFVYGKGSPQLTPIERITFLDQPVESAYSLLHGSVRVEFMNTSCREYAAKAILRGVIRTVRENKVNIVQL